ncbi:Eukaryotic translation initiation factor 2D [Arachnomyces sp. PD_36]|nr:Eukaryotic translation initiation factor 2D [Arachnomyces sp. PD_36]
MFKKKPTIKNLAPLRSSDRRKTADQIIQDYKIPVPASAPAEGSGDQNNETEPSSTIPTLSSIRSSLLPENSLSARFTTTAGPDLHEVHGTVYVGRHSESEGERVLWFRLESSPNAKLYPTVYTLWHNPRIIPLLHTPELVVQKLYGGADLMTPGLANGPPFPERAVKGAVVAVASLDKPDVPVFVGVCEIDVSNLKDVQGARGHAVRGIHWIGDEIWGWSASGRPGQAAPESLPEWVGDIEEVEHAVGGLELGNDNDDQEEAAGGVSLSADARGEKVPEPSTKEIDAAFHNAFIYALYQHRKDNPSLPNHGIEFPIQPSALISNYISPYLPIYSPEEAQYYQLKKTSWKNVKKFVKQLDKEKLVKSKDRSGGETVILDADFNDAQVDRFVPYRLPSKNAASKTHPDSSQTAASGNDPALGQTITLQSLFRPNEKLTPDLFPSLPHSDPRNHYPYSEASKHLNTYLSSPQHSPPLISTQNPRIITLNDFLRSRIFTSKSATDTSILSRGTVTRDALLKRLVEDPTLCSPYYLLKINPKNPSSTQQKPPPKPKAGHPPKVTITIERRTGTKVATKVVGLEVFGIVPSLLADDLQKKCASSTSVAQAAGAVKGVMEVFVQGDQRKVLEGVLEGRGVKKGWVEVVDKTKKGKK